MVLSWSKLHAVSCSSQEAKEMFYALQISIKLSSPSLSLHEILCILLENLCFLFCPNSYVREKICYFFAKTWYFVLHSTKLCLDLQQEIVLFIGKLLETWLSRPLKSNL